MSVGTSFVDIKDVFCTRQMRTKLTDIEYLAKSIEATGLINPLTVRKDGKRYRVVAGERRFRALQFLRAAAIAKNRNSLTWKNIEVKIRAGSDKDMERIQVQENIQQRQPTSLEYFRLVDRLRASGMTIDEVAGELKITPSWVSQLLNARAASAKVKKAWENGELTAGKAILMGQSLLPATLQNKLINDAQEQSEAQLKETLQEVKDKSLKQESSRVASMLYRFKPLKTSIPIIEKLMNASKITTEMSEYDRAYAKGIKQALASLVVIKKL